MAENSKLNTNSNIVDVELSAVRKKFFRFDKDDNRMVELNIADMGIMSRLAETYPKLEQWLDDVRNIKPVGDDESVIDDINAVSATLNEIDAKMRDAIDYIFNAKLSAVAAPDGTMYDVFNGQFRFEYILELMLSQYENNMTNEFKKMQKHTKKYTKTG